MYKRQPLNSLYNPEHNKNGSTSIVKGLGRVNGKWCCIIASDNKKHAGTWVPGQADNLLRGSDTAKRLRIPLIYLLECAGVELDKQEKVYPCLLYTSTSGGTDFIAIALSERKNIDAWNYILAGNAVMLTVAGLLFGWERALYSIIFQFTSTQTIRLLDPDSGRATLFIVTGRETVGGVCAQIQDTHHTATLIEGVGLYNGEPCVMIYTVVSVGESKGLVRKVRQADPKAFVNVIRTERVHGRCV